MRRFMVRSALGVLLIALVVNGSCASACAQAAADAHRHVAAEGHVYERDVDALWPDVVAALGDDARLVDVPHRLEGPWRESAPGTTERVVARVLRVGAGRARVEVLRETIVKTDGGGARTTSTRAGDLEWRVLQRADPNAAARIEADAQRRADEMRASCRACGDVVEAVIAG